MTKKNILITGCSSGIGFAAAKYLHQRGYRVLASCRKASDVEMLQTMGIESVVLDLDDADSVQHAADEVIQRTDGRLYALFNNGGYGCYGLLNSISRAELEQQFSTNLFGIHQLTQLLLPAMLPHGEGRIIQTSSVMGLISTPGRGAYAASKYALEAWSDALRMELYDKGIYVSLIEPGPISTNFSHNVLQTNTQKPVKNPAIASYFTLPPDAVLPKLRHALESRKPRLRYPVTAVSHAITLLRRILSGRMMDRLLR